MFIYIILSLMLHMLFYILLQMINNDFNLHIILNKKIQILTLINDNLNHHHKTLYFIINLKNI